MDRLGTDLVGALRKDHVYHFLGHIHIRGLKVVLQDAAEARLTGSAQGRRSAGFRFLIKILPDRGKSGGVIETHELNLEILRAAGCLDRHLTFRRDRNILHIGRNRSEAAQDLIAIIRHHIAIGRNFKPA